MRNVFPERLRALREAQRPVKSMVLVSQLCGLDDGAVRGYESGQREPTRPALIALARFYGVTTDYLLGLSNEKNL